MPVTLLDPVALPRVGLYRQVAVATGSRTVYLAGQVAVRADGSTVGAGDLAEQAAQCYRNVAAALAEAGATFDDVVKLTVYLVDWTPDKMAPLAEGIARASDELGVTIAAPLTGLGVAALASPEHLVEVEAIAVLD